jgi:membrane protease YdiL (CAAX protease family)
VIFLINKKTLKNPFTYLTVTIVFSYSFWILAILSGGIIFENITTTILFVIGGISPLLFGIIFFYLNNIEKEKRKDFWIRIIDVRRIKVKWFIVIFGLNIITVLIAVLIAGVLMGIFSLFMNNVMNFSSKPAELFFFIGFTIVVVFIEEPGWRGYSLENLQEKNSALKSSIILGVFWAFWHIPMYFLPGLVISGKGFLSLWFWVGMFSIIPQTIIITWIYNNTDHSVLSAMIFHFMMNFLGEMFMLDGVAKIIRESVWLMLAILVVKYYGSKTMIKTIDFSQKDN